MSAINNFLSKVKGLFYKEEIRLLILGCSGVGKTALLFRWKLGQFIPTATTIGFNVEEIVYKNIKYRCVDVGGGCKIRDLWPTYFTTLQTNAVIFIVDSTHLEPEEVRHRIAQLLRPDCCGGEGGYLLILCNKQDLPGALTPIEIAHELGLNPNGTEKYRFQPAVATTLQGLLAGVDWLTDSIKGANLITSVDHSPSLHSQPTTTTIQAITCPVIY
eukprot:gene4284-5002_t